MYCSIHTNIHPMLGVDWHMGTPGPPAPPVLMPHFVAQILGGLMTSAQLATTVLSHNFMVVKRASDIGMGIGHVAPNILFPILVLTSGSVSEFGAFSVQSGGTSTAIAPGIYVGINLNCSDPVPGASINGVIAPGCNLAGFNLADFGASMLSVAADVTISGVINLLGGALTKGAMKGIAGLAGKISVSSGLMVAVVLSTEFGGGVAEQVIGKAIGVFVGSPVGPSVGPAPGNWPGNQTDAAIESMMENHYAQGESMN
ncbi:hypothetical protein B0O79_1251 [Flavobacteriaceae bacterium MAR_2009_75]|nr:hypothetical protein B0O79_1251 [Flavobacteriaceae bacterium MAR_2009_75]